MIDDMDETLELIAEQLDWLLMNPWSVDFLREKLKGIAADVALVRNELSDLRLGNVYAGEL